VEEAVNDEQLRVSIISVVFFALVIIFIARTMNG
jgi:hypothetical protein